MDPRVILLVEDNPDDEALTLRAFKKNSISNEVIVVRDGAEALDYLLNPATRDRRNLPDLILLDLKLPKIDGLEVLRRLRSEERTRLIPIVALTSSKEQQDLKSVYLLGGNSYIRKPVDFSKFTEAVREAHLYWMILNEPPPKV